MKALKRSLKKRYKSLLYNSYMQILSTTEVIPIKLLISNIIVNRHNPNSRQTVNWLLEKYTNYPAWLKKKSVTTILTQNLACYTFFD